MFRPLTIRNFTKTGETSKMQTFQEELDKLTGSYRVLLGSTSEALIKALTNPITSTVTVSEEKDLYADIIKTISYDGFSVQATLLAIAENWGKRKKATFEGEIGGIKIQKNQMSADPELDAYIVFACLVFLQRGSNAKKIISKTKKEHRNAMGYVLNCIGVSTTAGPRNKGESLSSDVVTLPRVAACYPHFCLELIDKVDGINLIGPSHIGTVQLPKVMRHNLIQATIPEAIFEETRPLLRFVAVKIDII